MTRRRMTSDGSSVTSPGASSSSTSLGSRVTSIGSSSTGMSLKSNPPHATATEETSARVMYLRFFIVLFLVLLGEVMARASLASVPGSASE